MKLDPAGAAILCLFLGCSCAVGGVYLLAGRGWALVAASVPLLILGFVLVRGLVRASPGLERGG